MSMKPFDCLRYHHCDSNGQVVEQGTDGSGENQLGLMYLRGRGVEKDIMKAITYFESAALKGDVNARAHLAAIQLDGKGNIEEDKAAAIQRLIELKDTSLDALYYLGLAHLFGNGVTRDFQKAYSYFKIAAD